MLIADSSRKELSVVGIGSRGSETNVDTCCGVTELEKKKIEGENAGAPARKVRKRKREKGSLVPKRPAKPYKQPLSFPPKRGRAPHLLLRASVIPCRLSH
ncbi:hypothetical protein DENSPDRAFT_846389 [Dentipellis sp. KUC8613]|nr:hypothetical protein DENSPDRAFT_846389 [Dentipellis sp. KUC8613]